MGLPFFWLETTLTLVVFFAALLALCQRLPGFILRFFVSLLLLCLFALPAAFFTYQTWNQTILGWIAMVPGILAILTVLVFLIGTRPYRPSAPAAARSWNIGRLFLITGLGAILSTATLLTLISSLQGRLATLQTEAYALTVATSPPAMLDRDDASPLYESARDILLLPPKDPALKEASDKWLDSKQVLNPTEPGLESYVNQQAAGLDLVAKAVLRPGIRPMRPIGEGQSFNSDLRRAASALSLSARFHAAKGNANLAYVDVANLYRVVDHQAGSCTNSMDFLVACALESIAKQTLEVVLTQTRPKGGDLAPLLELPPILYRSQFRRGLSGEKAHALNQFTQIINGPNGAGGWGFGLLLLDREVDNYDIIVRVANEEMEKSYPECIKMWQNLERESKSTGDIILTNGPDGARMLPYSPLSRLFANALPRTAFAAFRSDANRRLATVAIAVARYRAVEGKLPQKPEDLVPKYLLQMPQDPFDGQALKMKTDETGIVISSVGQDSQKNELFFKIGASK